MKVSFSVVAIILLAACCTAAQNEVKFNVTDVIVYPQNTALIRQDAAIAAANYFATVLPQGAYADSLRVTEDGGVVLKVEAFENQDDIQTQAFKADQLSVAKVLVVSVNSQIKFETEYGEYSGKLAGFDENSGLMVLEAVNYTVAQGGARFARYAPYILMSSSQIREMVLENKPQMPQASASTLPATYNPYYQQTPKKVRVEWEDAAAAARKVRMSYLSAGIGWAPVYHLDLPPEGGQGRLTFIAQVKNALPANYSGVRLRLVAGNINIRSSSGYQQPGDTVTQAAMRMEESGYAYPLVSYQPQRISVGEYEVYDFPERQDLREKETLMLPVYDGKVDFKRQYVWDARSSGGVWQGYSKYDSGDVEGKVQNIYLVMNSNRTWPYGIVSVYQEGMLIGQDTISWTPDGAEAKVTVGFAPDIDVKRRETVKAFYRQGNYNEYYDHTAYLTLKNRKATKATVTVIDEYPRYAHNFTASMPYSEEPGNLMKWHVDLQPGQETEVTYKYTTE